MIERPPYRQIELEGETLQVYLEGTMWVLVDMKQIIRAAVQQRPVRHVHDKPIELDEAVELLLEEVQK